MNADHNTSVTSIDFYFNAADRLQVACRLAGKAVAQSKQLVVYVPDHEMLHRIDRMLWTWPATGFVPHCLPGDAVATETPVLVTEDPDGHEHRGILLNLSTDCPPRFERFERLLEIVSITDEEKLAGRARYKYYRDRGYAIENHDLAAGGQTP